MERTWFQCVCSYLGCDYFLACLVNDGPLLAAETLAGLHRPLLKTCAILAADGSARSACLFVQAIADSWSAGGEVVWEWRCAARQQGGRDGWVGWSCSIASPAKAG